MQQHTLHKDTATAQTMVPGGQESEPKPAPGAIRATDTAPSAAAQLCRGAAVLAGLWIAISPWFLTVQAAGANARATDLIVGLVIAALAMLAVGRNRIGLLTATAAAGVWAIIAPFILAAKFPVTASMYWSNSWAGGLIIALAISALLLGRATRAN